MWKYNDRNSGDKGIKDDRGSGGDGGVGGWCGYTIKEQWGRTQGGEGGDEETEVDRTIGESVFKIWRESDQDVKIHWNGEGGESKKSRDNGDQR